MTAPARVTDEQARAVLACPMGASDSGADTVRGYLTALLARLWERRGEFSGKRPFGKSSWQHDLYLPLIRAGIVPGTLDEDGCVEHLSRDAEARADALIGHAITLLGQGPAATVTMGHLDAIEGALDSAATALREGARIREWDSLQAATGVAWADIQRAAGYARTLKSRVPDGPGFEPEAEPSPAFSASAAARAGWELSVEHLYHREMRFHGGGYYGPYWQEWYCEPPPLAVLFRVTREDWPAEPGEDGHPVRRIYAIEVRDAAEGQAEEPAAGSGAARPGGVRPAWTCR